MPKSRKKKNADFQKVKLKVGRRLPKGQNETTTSFKSRTIHIVQQLKNPNTLSEPHTKRKLVLKDLLPKCDHHNSRVRLAGVEGMIELVVADQDAVLTGMADVFRRVLPLLSDRDPLVRQALLKLFRIIFATEEERKVVGFFPLLSTHLCCAMTHICDDVQQDSLQFFDLLLDKFPAEMTGTMSQMLVQIFMEQISTWASAGQGAQKDRTLVVNPNSKQSSPKARAKILERVRKLVSAFLERNGNETGVHGGTSVLSVNVADYPKLRESLVPPWVRRMWRSPYLSLDSSSDPHFKENEYAFMLTDAGKLQKFVEQLFPLLKQCWAEVCPSSSGTGLLDRTDQKQIEKSLPLLTSVVGVLHALVECWLCLCRHKEQRNLNPKDEWFHRVFRKQLQQLLMPNFPLAVPDRTLHNTGGQTTKLSPLQMSVLRLNLSVVEILASFPAVRRDGEKVSGSKGWQMTVLAYLLDQIGQCFGADLSRTATAVLRKVFFNFSSSKKLDKLLKRAHKQYSKAHPLSGEKRQYLAVFEALAFDDSSPYRDRLELLQNFFQSVPDLLLRLPKEGTQTAETLVKIIQRGVQQNRQPFIAVLRENAEKLFDVEKGILATSDPCIHTTMCQAVYYLFRMDPPSAPQLKLFAQNCRLPQVSIEVAKTLINSLDITFWDMNHDKAVLLKQHQPRFMTFLTGMISGHTKEEIEALQLSGLPRVPSLVGIVWNCSLDKLNRHADIVEWCKVRFHGYLKPCAMLSVMQGVWTAKVIRAHRWLSIATAFGILTHWADMVTHAFQSSDLAHIDGLHVSETSQDPSHSNKEMLEALESVKLHLHDFARLCLSVAYGCVSRDVLTETDDGKQREGVDKSAGASQEDPMMKRMWEMVVNTCQVSLRILVKMCQQMTEIVQAKRDEREALTILRLATRLLQTPELIPVWGKDTGDAVSQLDALQTTAQKCCPSVASHQWWSDFVYAVDILKQQLSVSEPMQQ